MQAIKFGAAGTGYVCGTVGKPGVIVVQEWWGVTTVRVAAPPPCRPARRSNFSLGSDCNF